MSTQRRGAAQPSSLGPVPPTPANWVDEDSIARSRSPAVRGLHIDTGGQTANQAPPPLAYEDNSSTGINRSYGKREPSTRGIRERRSESRAARERERPQDSEQHVENESFPIDSDTSARPADLVLTLPNSADLSRRRAVKLASPRTNRLSITGETLLDPIKSKKHGEPASSPAGGSSRINTRNLTSPEVPTPPFSPATEAADGFYRSSASIPPKALPTPPLQRSSDEYLAKAAMLANQSPKRPVSHILHTPNDETSTPSLMPTPSARHSATLSSNATTKFSDQESFAKLALERHQAFVEKEIAATSDQERLELFAQFIVSESRLRRDRYSAAFDFMAGDIMDLTRELWKSYNSGRRSITPTAPTTRPEEDASQASNTEHRTSMRSSAPSPASSKTNMTPRTEPPESPASVGSQEPGRDKGYSSYQPCLSPILSMRASTEREQHDGESRGRPASRWWEQSADGSQGRAGGKIVRSKRESKFMGLAREERFNLQYMDEPSPRSFAGPSTPGPSTQPPAYISNGPNDYPPEKVDWHEEQIDTPRYPSSIRSVPATPNPRWLEISRLVTLPPPYPRHYPAVNNNHPDLAPIRNNHRSIIELDDAQSTRGWFKERLQKLREQKMTDAEERKRALRQSIQQQIQNGTMSFAEAAAAEASFEEKERQQLQADARAEFDLFEKDVSSPLNALFSERVTKATACIDQLCATLSNDSVGDAVNEPQEEGDEKPELLERLTLLKWLFEARELCHKELFAIESERNDRYKKIVLIPYRIAGMADKVAEVEAFFTKDALESQLTFETAVLKRFESFTSKIESNVTRGVEDQVSAFWDIAPGLLETIQKVPRDLASAAKIGFNVNIPAGEYDDNPAYHEHPLQYLHTLLSHAEKSAYQHIEAQTNLLCLMHEVRSLSLAANTRCLATQRCVAGENNEIVEEEMSAVKKVEEERLTLELRERVGLVEDQWKEALGDGLTDCRKRVEEYLAETGGWDDSLSEEV